MVSGRSENIEMKIIIDVGITALLFFLSGYQFWGQAAHEWAGIIMLALLIVHNILNLNWYKNLFKGKYPAVRTTYLITDIILLTAMALQMYSGIVLSREIFDFMIPSVGLSLARKMHILGAYWGFIFVSIHIGLHWNMIVNGIRKKTGIEDALIYWSIGILTAMYGVFAFVKRDFITYMFLRNEFVFMDYNELPIMFYIDYAAIAVVFICAMHCIMKFLIKKEQKQ